MNFYSILRSAHSGWRYIVFVLLILAFVSALVNLMGNKPYTAGSRKLNLFALISVHVQVLFGLVLYFVSPLVEAGIRYWKMEHISMMIIAAVLVTIGNSKSKKAATDGAKHRAIALFFGIAILIIIGAIVMMTKADPSKGFLKMS